MVVNAQIIELDNAGHPDHEVIIYNDDFYELFDLLYDPIGYMAGVGFPMYHDRSWVLRSPVTAILSSEEHRLLNRPLSFDLGPSIDTIPGMLVEKGAFIAQFAKQTHTLFVTYKVPDPVRARKPIVSYTKPHGIRTRGNNGTLHFDLNIVANPQNDPMKTVDAVRAAFIVDHLANPDVNTWNLLEKTPVESEITTLYKPGSFIPRVTPPPPVPGPVNFKQAGGSPFIVVEGLSAPATSEMLVVCTQSGAVYVPDDPKQPDGPHHWELYGMIVKNYVEPGP